MFPCQPEEFLQILFFKFEHSCFLLIKIKAYFSCNNFKFGGSYGATMPPFHIFFFNSATVVMITHQSF